MTSEIVWIEFVKPLLRREAPVEARHRVGVAVHDVAAEAVHQHLLVHPGRREARRHNALRLLEDIGEEQVGRGRVAL